jgi:hypothetical protein
MRNSAEDVARFAEEQSETTQRAARNGLDLLQGYAELFRRTVETSAGLVTQLAEHNASGYGQQFARAEKNVDDVREHSSRSVETMGVASEATGEIFGEWVHFFQRQAQHNIHYWNLLVRCRQPQDLLVAQTEFLRGSADNILQSWRRIAGKSMGAGQEITSELTRDAA